MGFKKMDRNMSLAEYSLENTLSKNRALERLNQINSLVDWERVERILVSGYPVGKKDEGNAAYAPLLLFKTLLLAQWFGIRSDPELEIQINDRVSFHHEASHDGEGAHDPDKTAPPRVEAGEGHLPPVGDRGLLLPGTGSVVPWGRETVAVLTKLPVTDGSTMPVRVRMTDWPVSRLRPVQSPVCSL